MFLIGIIYWFGIVTYATVQEIRRSATVRWLEGRVWY